MKYRPDIDGVRAISILSVVGYHFEIPLVTGGFVGVDIFFVISGFLIGKIILGEAETGQLSLLNFYERRIRRIFPVLFAVMAATLLFTYFYFLPDQFAPYGESLLFAAMFFSNVLFWREGTDYFVDVVEVKPLLHTWSLSIEEQFYLFFPLIVLLIFRISDPKKRKTTLVSVIVAVFAMSLLTSVALSKSQPIAAFYMSASRAWELALGVALAAGVLPCPASAAGRHVAATLGLVLIGVAVFVFSRATPYPGFNALAPCIGAALIIMAGTTGNHWATRALQSAPVVFVGWISYSLYLVHWPIFALFKYYAMRSPTHLESVVLIVLSIAISVLSWRFVEQPFRRRIIAPKQRQIYYFGAGATLCTVIVGTTIYATHGLPRRISPEIREIAQRSNYLHKYRYCHNRTIVDINARNICKIGAANAPPTFVLWGDSHADMYDPTFAAAAERVGTSGYVTTRAGCPPVTNVRKTWITEDDSGCDAFNFAVARMVLESKSIKKVFLAGFWQRQAAGLPGRYFVDDLSKEISAEETGLALKRSLVRQIELLKDKEVHIIADMPSVGIELPIIIARRMIFGRGYSGLPLSMPKATYHADQKYAFAVFDELQKEYGVDIVRLDDVLCPHDVCDYIRNGQFVYRDQDHLSNYGALLLTEKFEIFLASSRQKAK